MSSTNWKHVPPAQPIDIPQFHINYPTLLPYIIALIYPPLAIWCAQDVSRYHLLVSFLITVWFGYQAAQVHAVYVLRRRYGDPFSRLDPQRAANVNLQPVEARNWL